MGKKKANSRAKRKAAAQKADVQQKKAASGMVKEAEKESEKKTEENTGEKAEQSEQLSVYTVTAMLEVLIAAATTVLAMIIWAKPAYYLMEALFVKQYDKSSIDILDYFYFADTDVLKYAEAFMLAADILLALATVLAVIVVVRAIDASKKPYIWMNIAGFVFSCAALVLFICSGYRIMQEINGHEYLGTLEQNPSFTVYAACFVVMIVNIVGALVNIFASMTGLKKWKKQGTTY